MPEGETLPKENTSKAWLDYADKKLKEFKDYHSERNMLWQQKNRQVLGNDYSRILSNNELQARKRGMQLLREETKAGMRKGGKVRATGQRKLHRGESVARNVKSRSSGRR
jgi:hypothetical protein